MERIKITAKQWATREKPGNEWSMVFSQIKRKAKEVLRWQCLVDILRPDGTVYVTYRNGDL